MHQHVMCVMCFVLHEKSIDIIVFDVGQCEEMNAHEIA